MSLYSTTETPRIQVVAFDLILPLWRELWPDREIRAMSSMLFDGGFDMGIYERFRATYWGCYAGDELVGVNSGHRSSDHDFRSRGLFVVPAHRKFGIAKKLLATTEAQARNENCRRIWSYPRLTASSVYESCGYVLSDRNLRTGDANRFAAKDLR